MRLGHTKICLSLKVVIESVGIYDVNTLIYIYQNKWYVLAVF